MVHDDPGGRCLDDAAASLYVAGQLGPEEEQQVEEHVDACASCRRHLSELARAEPRPNREEAEILGHFRIVRRIGKGGMGVVYEGWDETLGRPVALKVLPDTIAADPVGRARLLREANLAARVSHPNVATVFEVGEQNGRVYIAMELVLGRVLSDLIGALSFDHALAIARDVANGVGRAHELGIVHRDIKPRNVMVTATGAVKLLDFGLAKVHEPLAAGAEAGITEDGTVLGTPAYMSPEQALGKAVDVRSDVFALGVLIYELVSCRRPFAGDTPAAVVLAIASRAAPRLSALNSAVSPDLERLVARCLEREPSARYADGREVARALEALEGAFASATIRPDRLPRARRWAVVAAAGLLFVAFIALAGRRFATRRSAPQNTPVANADAPFVRLVDLPAPPAKSAEARAAYEDGMRAWHDGMNSAYRYFDRAVELDPHFAAAGLRQAEYFLGAREMEPARAGYRVALAGRDSLSERDRAILAALQPAAEADPPGWVESAERLEALRRSGYPRDEGVAADEIALYMAASSASDVALLGPSRLTDLSELAESLIQDDPSFATARRRKAQIALAQGRTEEARSVAQACLEASPRATYCIDAFIDAASSQGDCVAVTNAARRYAAISPEDGTGASYLAQALLVRGEPEEALRAAVAKIKVPPGDADRFAAWWDVKIAVFRGDFVAADAAAERMGAVESPVVDARRLTIVTRVRIAEERGDLASAAALARAYLRGRAAFETPDLEDDPVPELLAVERSGGLLSDEEVRTELERWRRGWQPRLRPELAALAWIAGEARVAMDATSAVAAMSVMPPSVSLHNTPALVGHVALLAGKPDVALPLLTEASAACEVGREPLASIQASLDLGLAREALGEDESACEAYRRVLEFWSSARPRSLTAERARARIKAIRCLASAERD